MNKKPTFVERVAVITEALDEIRELLDLLGYADSPAGEATGDEILDYLSDIESQAKAILKDASETAQARSPNSTE
jgi:hypothetical protein